MTRLGVTVARNSEEVDGQVQFLEAGLMDDSVIYFLEKYLEGNIPLRKFYYWFMANTFEENTEVINIVKLRFYEYTSKLFDEEVLKKLLREDLQAGMQAAKRLV